METLGKVIKNAASPEHTELYLFRLQNVAASGWIFTGISSRRDFPEKSSLSCNHYL